jgi:hypothetical protein
MRLGVVAVVALVAGGCASVPAGPADYGPPPSPQGAEAAIQQFFRTTLKDPYSMRDLLIHAPQPECYPRGLINGGGSVCGHKVCVSINAKNSFGAYTGAEVYVFWFRGDRVDGGVFPNAGACPRYLDPSYRWIGTTPAN